MLCAANNWNTFSFISVPICFYCSYIRNGIMKRIIDFLLFIVIVIAQFGSMLPYFIFSL